MAQSKANKLYRTFVRGLQTEASYLTYPEDTSFDESNTVLSRRGNRIRRLGINFNLNDCSPRSYDRTNAQTEFMWNSVASTANRAFLVVQHGSKISFFDRSHDALAVNKKSFEINLTTYARPGASDVRKCPCRFASGKGYLFVVGSEIEPLVVTYTAATDSITVTPIVILARDFEGLPDGLANDEEPAILNAPHFYNLLNQGWVEPNVV